MFIFKKSIKNRNVIKTFFLSSSIILTVQNLFSSKSRYLVLNRYYDSKFHFFTDPITRVEKIFF